MTKAIIPNNSPKKRGRSTPRHSLKLDTSRGSDQAGASAANINKIMAQYYRSGTLPTVNIKNPLYGDFSNIPEDIHEVREAVQLAEDRFMQLPSSVRSLCDNDWVQFLDRFNSEDPKHREELINAGLKVTTTPINPDTAEKTPSEPTSSETPSPTAPPKTDTPTPG